MLPGQAEEVQAGLIGDASAMADTTVGVDDRQIEPGIVGLVARRPDDGVGLRLCAIGEADGSAGRGYSPGLSTIPSRFAFRGFDPISVSRWLSRLPMRDSTETLRTPSFVPHQKICRPKSLSGSGVCLEPTASTHLVVGRQFLGDLIPRVPAAHDDGVPRRHIAWSSIPGAVRLVDVCCDRTGERGDARPLEGAGSNDDLVGEDRPSRQLGVVSSLAVVERGDRAVQLDRKVELPVA